MKSKICALVAISVLIAFMAWQCFTWPVIEMDGRWVEEEHIETYLATSTPHQRPPMPAEIAFRVLTCAASLLLGAALVRVLRSRKPGQGNS